MKQEEEKKKTADEILPRQAGSNGAHLHKHS
jgi:hypothetical protein